ncbi:FadR family transcriptional regulator [Mycobacterium bohemicum DSM 44277]|uniref:GntR family transcriptional regulator n=2 Tax=Mycobacterium bohemicum TaxID=56425 RepID=A0A1X1R4G2_MYCBE|nr:FCD domain-containing protein [Mycobacterium bohemicum]MCV6968462.1 FadR family transcriptional regulator [Mycobacterium bohemicum]ORU99130.1 GntR family transcriptional regulator [Mycobacterium bohemicum]CPR05259.1 FadR family transcriptional regulator [Mycobacterium bohemicum DSM 44277]
MTAAGVGQQPRPRLTTPRLAETVADELRRQIVDGEIADGTLLPPQAVLVERFNVSLVSLREALRILVTEGLISIRRGNQGGAVVHAPDKTKAGYMLGLLLQSQYVKLDDLAAALKSIEPTCAAMAAQRPDRAKAVIPVMQRINAAMADTLDDGPLCTEYGRQFHDSVVQGSGNSTLIAVVGSLEALWTHHEQKWAERRSADGAYPTLEERKLALKTHQALADAIEIGDAERAQHIAARHLADTQLYVLAEDRNKRIIATTQHGVFPMSE